jgi:hypothetical protein
MIFQSWFILILASVFMTLFPTPVAANPVVGNVLCVFVFLGLAVFFGCVGLGIALIHFTYKLLLIF